MFGLFPETLTLLTSFLTDVRSLKHGVLFLDHYSFHFTSVTSIFPSKHAVNSFADDTTTYSSNSNLKMPSGSYRTAPTVG